MPVTVVREGHIRIVTIDRPDARNAINRETRAGLEEAFTDFAADDDAWLAILTAAGDKAFSAGADLKEMDPAQRADPDYVAPPFGFITRDFHTDKPMIAAINGAAFGGGLELALACDLRVAAEHAVLGLTEAKWALLPGGGGTQRLVRSIPRAIALEMLMTGAPITATRAFELGLVNAVVPSADLMTRAMELARTIVNNGPLAVRAAKQAVDEGADVSLAQGLALEQRLSKALFSTDDAVEGPRAFAEKRPPSFTAR
ncbi:enoyl-CoA hydratase/isomerase family protein [Microbacterium sp. PI-1]|uniref:enoyl-CoA hydratase-related protein n=1 Tax=Microbacterium sp. PI-1 TaxID=2545631 RepID=UPI00103C7F71|nr:enoyl-CoA hydratase-related protein [Microbacterium sp. PI-1]TCJ21955.1 enoyl-CoA hydratase/isomerase family protein [Microbacterium sp. PI-1]